VSTTLNLTELRHGTGRDLPQVAEVMHEAFDPKFGEAWTTAQCMGMLSLPGVWLTLASVGGMVAGFALMRATLDEGELLLLAVRPRFRGRGVGRALLRSIIADARERSVKKLHLEVRAGNDAIRLYTHEGFEKVGERRGYYRGKHGQQFDAQTFARTLA
jgi:ribosomal-protein-alanine N-acetyltransferase